MLQKRSHIAPLYVLPVFVERNYVFQLKRLHFTSLARQNCLIICVNVTVIQLS